MMPRCLAMKTGFRNNIVSPNYQFLKENARRMRAYPTDAERLLWKVISEDKLGVRFRRQHIIGDYIVDFACLRNGLIIEIDGGYHANPEQQIEDEQRTVFLQSRGFQVIRFTNEEVLNNLDYDINSIKQNLQ
jgi:very-short-patch-repair endonuclease